MTRELYDRRLGGTCDEAHKGRCGDHPNQGPGARGQCSGRMRRTSDLSLRLPHAGLCSLLAPDP
jgi:hypothetical protein